MFWQQKKQNRKEKHREARKEVVAAQQDSWEALTPEEREAMRQKAIEVHEARRRIDQDLADQSTLRLTSSSTPTVVFDMGFAHVMNERDCRSTASQLKYAYSIMRRSGFLMKPFISSFDASHPTFGPLSTFEGFKKFPVPIDIRKCVDCFPDHHAQRKLVFLTADTEDVLTSIDDDHVYVVGAFVDHNTQKGLTKQYADAAGIRTARLPLVENIAVGNLCKVLTINHVVDVLVTYLQTHSWKDAFATLPTRRVNEKKKRGSNVNNDDSGDDDEVDAAAADE